MSNVRVIKSYVFHKDKCFFISTINRLSSACVTPVQRYNETIVWEYDYDARERGDLIHMDGGITGSIKEHIRICESYHKTGEAPQ